MKTAIRPDFYFKGLPTLQNDREAEKKGATEEERQVYAMAQTSGWNVVQNFIERLSKDLDMVNKNAIENGAPLDEIGRNTVVISLTQDILQKVLDKVSDSIEACTQNEQ